MTANLQDLAKTVHELVDLNDQIEHLEARREELKNMLMQALPAGSKTDIDGIKITVTKPTRSLNTTAITKAYPVTQHPELYTPKLDSKKVREHIAQTDLEAQGFIKEGTQQVRLTA